MREARSPDLQRFAACAYPVNPSAGTWMYIISEDNILFRKMVTGQPPSVFPKDPLAEGWEKFD